MREFMGQGEHLPGLRIRPIDKDERRPPVGQSKTTKFLGIERAAIVAQHDPAYRDEHADLVGLSDKETQRVFPCSAIRARCEIEAEGARHVRGDAVWPGI